MYQVHSPDAVVVEGPWTAERPKADGMVTAVPGLALGITTADCGPVLFADPEARVIGAAHAGWRGAVTGVLESTVEAMERLGARREKIIAVLGPTIGQNAYEVGPDFIERFTKEAPGHERFLKPGERPGHAMFDLPGFIGARLATAGIGGFTDLEPVHLFRRGAVLQLSPHHPPQGAGLRPADLGDRAHSLMPATSGVSQARCWPPSTAIIWPVTLRAPAR